MALQAHHLDIAGDGADAPAPPVRPGFPPNSPIPLPHATRRPGPHAAPAAGGQPPPLPVRMDAAAAALALLEFLQARPHHAGHQAIVRARGAKADDPLHGGQQSSIVLPLDLVEIMECNPGLAQALVCNTEGVRVALVHALLDADVLPPESRFARLWLRFTSVPVLPEPSISSLTARLVSRTRLWRAKGDTNGGDNSAGLLVHLHGVVTAASTPYAQTYVLQTTCRACGKETHCFGSQLQERTRCCESEFQVEDLSGRVMVPVQDVWLGDLGSALGALGAFATAPGSVLVRLTDDLLGPEQGGLRVGDIVRIVGLGGLQTAPAAAVATGGWGGGGGQGAGRAAAAAEVRALHVGRVDPTAAWSGAASGGALGGCGGAGRARPSAAQLQELCDALMDALTYYVPYPLALALLVSAACVARPSPQQQQQHGHPPPDPHHPGQRKRSYEAKQLSLLVLDEAHGSMLLARVLRPAAHVLSAHSVCLCSHMDDALMPRLQASARPDQDGQDVQVVYSSVLTSANCGVLVADCSLLGSAKVRLQLSEALARGHIVLPGKKAGGGGSGGGASAGAGQQLPVTATVWAVTGGVPGGGDGFEGLGKGGKGKNNTAAMRDDGFHLVLPYGLDEDDAAAVEGVLGTTDTAHGGGSGGQGAGAEGVERAEEAVAAARAAGVVRRAMAACGALQPRFTQDAMGLLQRYVASVRQSGVGTLVPQAQVVATLVAAARGCASLLGRGQVLSHPDCVVAILLMETTLCTRFGSSYCNNCVPRMELKPELLLEEQLFSLYQQLELLLQAVMPAVSGAPGDWPSCV